MRNRIASWLMLLGALAFAALTVMAYTNVPTPPNEVFDIVSVQRRGYVPSVYIWAEAGNVTELRINATTTTRGWQGYYGNISGVITLDDAANNTLYSWALADPEGQIYAVRKSSVDWATDNNIECANISRIEEEEARLNFNQRFGQDMDGINETFAFTAHPFFTVANNTFAANECNFSISTYVGNAPDAQRSFNETLLYSQSDDRMIYMAYIIQGGSSGFKLPAEVYDFQMLVAEDGHDGDTTPVQYWFWVEIQ